jgi:hypothetical protein
VAGARIGQRAGPSIGVNPAVLPVAREEQPERRIAERASEQAGGGDVTNDLLFADGLVLLPAWMIWTSRLKPAGNQA